MSPVRTESCLHTCSGLDRRSEQAPKPAASIEVAVKKMKLMRGSAIGQFRVRAEAAVQGQGNNTPIISIPSPSQPPLFTVNAGLGSREKSRKLSPQRRRHGKGTLPGSRCGKQQFYVPLEREPSTASLWRRSKNCCQRPPSLCSGTLP